jgi:hypothetical protein
MADICGIALSRTVVEAFGLWLDLQLGTVWLVFAAQPERQPDLSDNIPVPEKKKGYVQLSTCLTT